MNETKVDDLGRTLIPSTIRKLLNINKGDKLIWKHEEGKIVVEKDEEGKGADSRRRTGSSGPGRFQPDKKRVRDRRGP